ncbi:MAG: aminodeoxychorismate synthase component I, partial [Gammaproteobacteria bacterium]|nr:aminodeoxychorismate synthase component I [Gammaproteobacteria bacterium]
VERIPATGLPFVGGAIGYFAYDLARRIERLPSVADADNGLPEMAIGIYDWAVVVDHAAHRAWLVAYGRDPGTAGKWASLKALFEMPNVAVPRQTFGVHGPVRANLTWDQYRAGFARIKRYIHDGHCYQVNYAQRFTASADGDPWTAYRTLRHLNPAPFSAYLHMPFGQVLSASPERFLLVQDEHVETKPIKGTRPRGSDLASDKRLAEELRNSRKDQAENLMIVDLLRNDIGKSCRSGSVKVPALFELQSFANVHHLVSTVTGILKPGLDALHVLRGCFPGGSITGAPKVRAMEIIEELEPHRRSVYCGAIGYLGFDGRMDTNIAIRTMICTAGQVHFYAGGGIVADSEASAEYHECFDKAAPTLQLFNQLELGRVGS